MHFVRPLKEQERQQLKRLTRGEVGRVSVRIQLILLSSRGYTVPKIAANFECDEATVRNWIERFEAGGVEGLRDRPRGGRPRKADAVARETIRHELEQRTSRAWLSVRLLDDRGDGRSPGPPLRPAAESSHGAADSTLPEVSLAAAPP